MADRAFFVPAGLADGLVWPSIHPPHQSSGNMPPPACFSDGRWVHWEPHVSTVWVGQRLGGPTRQNCGGRNTLMESPSTKLTSLHWMSLCVFHSFSSLLECPFLLTYLIYVYSYFRTQPKWYCSHTLFLNPAGSSFEHQTQSAHIPITGLLLCKVHRALRSKAVEINKASSLPLENQRLVKEAGI